MKIARTKNARRNILAGIVNKVVVLLLPFLVRTAFIYSLGAEYLGLNSLFTAILTVLNMTELGFSSAIIFSMYTPIANNDSDKISALLNFYRTIYRVIGVVIIVIGCVLLPFLPHLINGQQPDGLNIYVLFAIYLANTAASYLLFAYKKSLLEAFQRNDISSWIDTVTTGLTNLVQFVLLLVWHDIRVFYLYVITLLLFTVINNIINSVIVDRKYPQYSCKGKLDYETMQGIKKQVFGLMLGKLSQMTRNSFDSIFISAFIGLRMTTVYANYYYVLNAVVGLMTVLTNAMLGGIGNSVSTETEEKNFEDFRKFNFMYMWVASWATITMMCLYNSFMKIWVGSALTFSWGLPLLFSIYFYTLKIGDIRATYSAATGLWWENRYRAIAEIFANILLNYIFVKLWGLYGIIAATILPVLLINNTTGLHTLYKYYFKSYSMKGYYIENFCYLCTTVISGLVTYFVCSMVFEGIIGLILRAILCVIIPNIMLIIFYRKSELYHEVFHWAMLKFSKK